MTVCILSESRNTVQVLYITYMGRYHTYDSVYTVRKYSTYDYNAIIPVCIAHKTVHTLYESTITVQAYRYRYRTKGLNDY